MTKRIRIKASVTRALLVIVAVACAGAPLWAQAERLTNATIQTMVAEKVPATVIVRMIGTADPANTAFEVNTATVLALRNAEVPDSVIRAMEEQEVRQDQARALTNQTILDFVKAKVSTATILTRILRADGSKAKFDFGPAGRGELKQGYVPEEVILAMRQKAESIIDPDLDPPVLAAIGARITGGVIMANGSVQLVPSTDTAPARLQSPQFSEASTYLAFEAQPLWGVEGYADKTKMRRFGGSALVNVRMTSIAVAGVTQITAPSNDLLQSQKAVQFQFGGTVDYHLPEFKMLSSRFHWAIGWGGSFWLQSVTDAQRGVRIWNIQDDLYDAVTIGVFRASLFQQQAVGDGSRWRPAAYIDVSRGKFQNFERAVAVEGLATTQQAKTCLATPSACYADPLPESAYQLEKDWRTYIEMRLLLKNVYLGVDINNGNGRDDARFVGGVTVALDRFFAK